jgi:iron complex outermembrane receptor protein
LHLTYKRFAEELKMRIHGRWLIGFWLLCFGSFLPAAHAQPGGTVRGRVTLEASGDPLHRATVRLVQLRRTIETEEDGTYEFREVPPGTYEVSAHTAALSDERKTVTIVSGQTATVDFSLRLAPVREQITVTAAGREESIFDSFQSTSTVGSLELAQRPSVSLGDMLEGQPGVARRSFGSGSGRPVIRGFDGDRVLIMKDGIRTGTLSSQSGDHGEAFDPLELERVEVVKGPATLLYGSNAIGGVVNAISSHHVIHDHFHPGVTGYLTTTGGTANDFFGGAGGFEVGFGRGWSVAAHGGGNRTDDYQTPIGELFNSRTRMGNGGGALGWISERAFWKASYTNEDTRYGIPFAALLEEAMGAPIVVVPGAVIGFSGERVVFDGSRHNPRFTGGFRNLNSFVESLRLQFDYSGYRHDEIEVLDTGEEVVATSFDNKQFYYQGLFEQRKAGRLTGRFGFSGYRREYETVGAEALAPPVNQNNFAFFALEEVGFERLRLQFGGRVERSSFHVRDPMAGLPDRDFAGFSGAVGVHVPLWKGGAFVANYTHSFRSPALEELYNNGPHLGNVTFEVGNPDLDPERSNGVDLSLRHQSGRVRANFSFFLYGLDDFVFLAPTGNIEDGLIEAEFLQGNARYLGAEAGLELGVHRNLWLLLGLDFVEAETRSAVTAVSTGAVTSSGTPLPRIPPLRGRVGLDWRWRGLSVRPEGILVATQDDLFPTESRTSGYGLFNLTASYTVARQHYVQVFSVSGFNLYNKLYRNHLSFIKDLAPEIGGGVRFGYTVRFF